MSPIQEGLDPPEHLETDQHLPTLPDISIDTTRGPQVQHTAGEFEFKGVPEGDKQRLEDVQRPKTDEVPKAATADYEKLTTVVQELTCVVERLRAELKAEADMEKFEGRSDRGSGGEPDLSKRKGVPKTIFSVQRNRRGELDFSKLRDIPKRIFSVQRNRRPGIKRIDLNDIERMIRPLTVERGSESTLRISETWPERASAIDEARKILAAPGEPCQVDAQTLELLTDIVFKAIREAPPELLKEVVAGILRDPHSSGELRRLIAHENEFTDTANEATERLAPGNRPRQSLMFPFVLAAACLLGGGIAIPLLLATAKAELIYANTVGAISAVCAGAAIINEQNTRRN